MGGSEVACWKVDRGPANNLERDANTLLLLGQYGIWGPNFGPMFLDQYGKSPDNLINISDKFEISQTIF